MSIKGAVLEIQIFSHICHLVTLDTCPQFPLAAMLQS